MKIFWIILILVIAYAAIEAGVFLYKYKHLPDLKTPDQNEKSFGNGGSIRYIAAGDSTAVGIGATSLETTYPYQVAAFLAKSHVVDYKNIAVGGYTTKDVLEKQVQDIIEFKPDIVTISMGGNDATHLVFESQIIANYKSIISLLEKQTSAKIYITDIPHFNGARLLPWFYISLLEFRSGYINPKLLALSDDRTKIINIHDFGWSNYPDLQLTYSADHFHPNDTGYANWAKAFINSIEKP